MDKYNIELRNVNPFIDAVKESKKQAENTLIFDNRGKLKYE